jgi:PhoH-like ATPase
LDIETPDNQIIVTALTEKQFLPERKIFVVSRDVNMRVKCDSVGLLCEDYKAEQIVKDRVTYTLGLRST